MSKACTIINITSGELLASVRNYKDEGYRLAQACATVKPNGFEILYSLDKDHELTNLRLVISRTEEVESITKEYWQAFIYENEMHDLFGIKFLHNALDYNGKFFITGEPTPWLVGAPEATAAAAPAAEGGLSCNLDTCIYCGICSKECPCDAIEVDRASKSWKVDQDACVECGACVERCPKKCLALGEAAPATGSETKETKEVEYSPDCNPVIDEGLINNINNCIFCGICATACKINALIVDRKQKLWHVDHARCAQCSACIDKCPKNCLLMLPVDELPEGFAELYKKYGLVSKAPEETNPRPEPPVITADTKSNGATDQGLECDLDTCIYCGICVKACKIEALSVDRKAKVWVVDRDRCSQCSACVDKCPKKCLKMVP